MDEIKEHEVIFDQYELSAGKDMTYFMEKGMTADKILVILTPNYKIKAERREGGVGPEYSMITSEIYDNQLSSRIIPILRIGDKKNSVPLYIKSKIYHDMKDDTIYNSKFFELLRAIHDKPHVERPSKSKTLDLTINENYDEIIEKAENLNAKIELNKKIDSVLMSSESVSFAHNEIDKIVKFIQDKILFYTDKTKIRLSLRYIYHQCLKLSSINYTFQYLWSQPYIDSLVDSSLQISFWKGYLTDKAVILSHQPTLLYQHRLNFDMNINEEICWVDKISSKSFKTDELMKLPFVELINNEIEDMSKNVKR